MAKQIIYEAKGRAKEFSELACNLYDFCSHGCVYCFSPLVLHKNREAFAIGSYARVNAYDVLKSAKQWVEKGETRNVLLCFTCDPYMEEEQETQLTRKCIMALHEAGLNVTILTKGGLHSTRDFDILTPKDSYATTLTCVDDNDSLRWEPNAALPQQRIDALKIAHQKGIETWVSFEPVIYPEDTHKLLMLTKDYTGHYKVGTMNYHEHGKSINWRDFGWGMKGVMDKLGVKYYFKKDLLKEMGVTPETFKQTWECH